MISERLLAAARGDAPADLLLANARLVNVYSGEILPTAIAIADGKIAGFGPHKADRTRDLDGRLVTPGFIDAHVHIESSMAVPGEFARAVLPHGTTAVAADPHEIANVLGTAGLDYMLEATADLPLQVFFTLPSCVPATRMETAGAELSARDLVPYIDHPRILGLGEMMDFPGTISGGQNALSKIALTVSAGKPVDGHAPGVTGRALQAYRAAGVDSDHECTGRDEALEKLRLGFNIMVREGSGAKNLQELVPLITPANAHRFMWCTDDRHPHDLLTEGHIDAMIRTAIGMGLDPLLAIRIATLNPAVYFNLPAVGALAPGKRADLIILDDLESVAIDQVYSGGRPVAKAGEMAPDLAWPASPTAPAAMNIDPQKIDLRVSADGIRMRVIEIIPDQVVTRAGIARAAVHDGLAVADPARDLLKIAVIERHRGTGRTGIGFVRGMGLRQGAIASSVAHDAHNIVVVGAADEDMRAAVTKVAAMGGGLAIVTAGAVLANLALPIAGLMSPAPVTTIASRMDDLMAAARGLGATLADPFMTLAFLALPVIPALKITDHGLVDVGRFDVVPLFSTDTIDS